MRLNGRDISKNSVLLLILIYMFYELKINFKKIINDVK